MRLLRVSLVCDADIVLARQRARQIAEMLGFGNQDQIRFATAVSEICRNAIEHGGGGMAEFSLVGNNAPQLLEAKITDQGPGTVGSGPNGPKRGSSGLGIGLTGAERLVDRFTIEGRPGHGTKVVLGKLLSDRAGLIGIDRVRQIAADLAKSMPETAEEELKRQNRELLISLGQVRRHAEELAALNRELEDTNRGVVALYAELDEKAEHLSRADELKTKFLSNMSHEFRTPLNSILALCRFLETNADGPLTPEQERQVAYIRKSAEGLYELVEDLLDLAKVEAGKTVIRPVEFTVSDLFGALRGMFRPLLLGTTVQLLFDDANGLPTIYGDEGKTSQILRNLISNALKFTEEGEVRVSARIDAAKNLVEFSVKDTGIGIAPEHHQHIFEEFSQLESPVQHRVKGTGLGLPLSRRLATLMGGTIELESALGQGSTFSFKLPVRFESPVEPALGEEVVVVDPNRIPVLVVEDDPVDMMVYEAILRHSPYQIIKASSLSQVHRVISASRPRAVVLDIFVGNETAWKLLSELKSNPAMQSIPILVVSAAEDPDKAAALGADGWGRKPVESRWLLHELDRLVRNTGRKRVLVVDDDDVARYLLSQYLSGCDVEIQEAGGGAAGLQLARELKPDLILLDLSMPDRNGFQVLEDLAIDPGTAEIPAVIVTAAVLSDSEKHRLGSASAILHKNELSTAALKQLIERCTKERVTADA